LQQKKQKVVFKCVSYMLSLDFKQQLTLTKMEICVNVKAISIGCWELCDITNAILLAIFYCCSVIFQLRTRVHQKMKVQQMSCMCFSFLSLLENIFLLKVI